ncbi:glycosyltransferase involved in cell wall biosynthesis [Bradyrhizobium sp. GM22.5]
MEVTTHYGRWIIAGYGVLSSIAVAARVEFFGRLVSAASFMPSRLEGFGIVFAEAQARGLPCVGRAAFAMDPRPHPVP